MENVKICTRRCSKCKSEICEQILDLNYDICPNCGNYLRIHAKKRILSLCDENTFVEWDKDLEMYNPLEDEEYEDKIKNLRYIHDISEAVITGEIQMSGKKVAIGVMDSRFMMGSMGQYVGEKVTRLFEKAIKKRLPVILFCCSGGARMQEGIIALMQMEKTAAAVKKHSEEGLLYISILTNPTMGGVTASFATLADIVFAEKGALIGFAGIRVIEQNTGEKMPDNFQTAEFQLEHGLIDKIVERPVLKEELIRLFGLHEKKKVTNSMPFVTNISLQKKKVINMEENLTAWERVQIARSPNRPTSQEYINQLFTDFYELHEDRISEDDHAVIAGVAKFRDIPVTVIGTQKGKSSIQDAVYRNWGMPSPSGYRKILRLVKQAEKFKRPVVFFVDTIGASCGRRAEEQGQANTIANLLQEMSTINAPILSIIIGEAGSGGAFVLGVGNEVWMLQNAVYSILTPEGYASIIWKSNAMAESAALKMKLEAVDLYNLGVIDRIIYESIPVERDHMEEVCGQLREGIYRFIKCYNTKNASGRRHKRFRKY